MGTIEQPNLEKIAALEPDLILSSKLCHEQIYEQLNEIAPTVFSETTGVTWKENFEVHAEALGRTEEADRVSRGSHKGPSRAQSVPSVPRSSRGDHARSGKTRGWSSALTEGQQLARPQATGYSEDVESFEPVTSCSIQESLTLIGREGQGTRRDSAGVIGVIGYYVRLSKNPSKENYSFQGKDWSSCGSKQEIWLTSFKYADLADHSSAEGAFSVH